MTRWEYRIVEIGHTRGDEGLHASAGTLDQLGSAGWELVAVHPLVGRAWYSALAYLKRPVAAPPVITE